jgi:hypothetical protein
MPRPRQVATPLTGYLEHRSELALPRVTYPLGLSYFLYCLVRRTFWRTPRSLRLFFLF